MPTTRSSNRPPPKRAISPDSDDDDDYVKKPSARGARGGRRGENKQGGGRGGTRGRPRKDSSATGGKPPAKRGKKKANKSDSEEEDNAIDSDHLHDELKKCLKLLLEFSKSSHESYTFPFRYPVDAAALKLPDYHEIVKKPMDMATIKKKLLGEEYDTASEFKEDFKLMINNCLLYNNRSDPVSELAIQFRNEFASEWKREFPEDSDDFGKADDDRLSESEDDSDDEDREEDGEQPLADEKLSSTNNAESSSLNDVTPTSSEALAAHDETAEENSREIPGSELNTSPIAADSTTEETHS